MALELAHGLVADPAAAEARMDGEPPCLCDPAALVDEAEADRACTLAAGLDQKPAERLRLALRPLDLLEQAVPRHLARQTEERPHVFVRDQLEEEVHVVGSRPPDRDVDAHAPGASRRRSRPAPTAPVPSATPPRMSASPPSADAPKRSPRSTAP